MRIRKVVRKPVRISEPGLEVIGDVNAVIAANVGEKRSTSRVSSTSHIKSVQRTGRHAGGTDPSKEETR